MPDPKAGLLLRLPPDLKQALDRCARHNLRSTNRQAEAILRDYLARNGFLGERETDEQDKDPK